MNTTSQPVKESLHNLLSSHYKLTPRLTAFMRAPKPGLSAVVAYSGTRMECQHDHALSLLPPVPGEYLYEVVGCGYGWMSLGLKTLRSARNLMQNTLDFDVINPVDSQHDTCTCKAIWLTCWVRWVYLFLSL